MIQKIKELEQDLRLNALADLEPFGQAHIEIDEGRRGEGIPPCTRPKVNGVGVSIAVRVTDGRALAVEVKAALHPEDAADLNLPGKLHQPVDLEDMIHRQTGRAFISVRAIEKCSSLCHKPAVSSDVWAVRVGQDHSSFRA